MRRGAPGNAMPAGNALALGRGNFVPSLLKNEICPRFSREGAARAPS